MELLNSAKSKWYYADIHKLKAFRLDYLLCIIGIKLQQEFVYNLKKPRHIVGAFFNA